MIISRWVAGAGLALLLAGPAGAGTPAFPDSAAGDWAGTVQTKDAPRHLFLHIHMTHAGVIATLNSPEGPPDGVAVHPLAADDGGLAFAADGGRFTGQWSETNGRWEGTWTEQGVSAPLVLSFKDDSTMRTIARHRDETPAVESPGTPPADATKAPSTRGTSAPCSRSPASGPS